MVRSTWVKVYQNFAMPAQVFDEPLFDSSFGVVALFQIPVARQGEMKINMVAVP